MCTEYIIPTMVRSIFVSRFLHKFPQPVDFWGFRGVSPESLTEPRLRQIREIGRRGKTVSSLCNSRIHSWGGRLRAYGGQFMGNVADNWKEIVRKYQKPSVAKGTWQLVNSVGGYLALWGLMYWSLSVSYWLTGALALLAGGFLVRVFIIFPRLRAWLLL